MNTPKEKPRYSLPENLGYLLRHVWQWSKAFPLYMGVNILALWLSELLTMFLPKSVLGCLERNSSMGKLLVILVLFTAALGLLGAAKGWTEAHINNFQTLTRMKFGFLSYHRAFTVDYEQFDSAPYQELRKKTIEATGNNDSALEAIWPALIGFCSSLLGAVSYGAMQLRLCWWLPVISLGCGLLSYRVRKQALDQRFQANGQWTSYASRPYYLNDKAGDYHYGKDIRLFSMTGWFRDIFDINVRLCESWALRHEGSLWRADLVDGVLTLCREGIAYVYLIHRVLDGTLMPSDFVLYFAAIGGFSTWVLELATQLSQLRNHSNQICDYRAMLEKPDLFRHGQGYTAHPHLNKPLSIVLEHVSYRYPGAEADTIRDISLTIHPGEKLAIVGLNGAGKTTLVKLICGLLDPTEGRVLCNGLDVREFDRKEYYKLFSTVFQDFCILPLTIAEVLSGASQEELDEARLRECIAMAGLTEKIDALPRGIHSPLVRDVNEDAVELSGGETQRLMLARALYKQAPMVILDEPTAALDPIAEHQLYLKYRDMTLERTSLYISHRLASTRFCDRILYLEEGHIAEMGTHQGLLKQQGKYYALFSLQSQYYQEEKGGSQHD